MNKGRRGLGGTGEEKGEEREIDIERERDGEREREERKGERGVKG